MDFYQRIKDICGSQNKKLGDFLVELGINRETYKSARRQGNLLRADDALKIARALGVTVEYLIEGRDTQESPLL